MAEGLAQIEPPADDILALDEAMKHLQTEDPPLAEIVQLRYYTGLTSEETALLVGKPATAVKRDWRFARAWLARRRGEGETPTTEGGEGRRPPLAISFEPIRTGPAAPSR
jgi:DNA-directed RNA polymerase specialized sigma24 family protein